MPELGQLEVIPTGAGRDTRWQVRWFCEATECRCPMRWADSEWEAQSIAQRVLTDGCPHYPYFPDEPEYASWRGLVDA